MAVEGGGAAAIVGALTSGWRAQQAAEAARRQNRQLAAIRRYLHQMLIAQVIEQRFAVQQAQDEAFRRAVYPNVASILSGTPGTTTIEVAPAPDIPLRKTWRAEKAQAKRTGIVRVATRKEYRQEKKYGTAPMPTQISVASYGVNSPVVRGSRDDPAGIMVRRGDYLWSF